MDMLIASLGVLGAVMCVAAYFLLERGTLSSTNIYFYLINGVSALFILLSVSYELDSGDIGSVALEIAWIIISLMGVAKVLLKKVEETT